MIGPVDLHVPWVFLQAVDAAALHTRVHVLVHIDSSHVGTEDLLLLFHETRLDAVIVGARERPLAHCEELQDFKTLTNTVLYPHHAGNMKGNRIVTIFIKVIFGVSWAAIVSIIRLIRL